MALKQQSRNFLAPGTSLLAGLLLDSCFEAQFLTGHGCVLAHDPGVGDPCSKGKHPPRDPGDSVLGLSPMAGRKCNLKSSFHPPFCMHWEPTSLPLEGWSPGLLWPLTLTISLLSCSRPQLDPQAFPGRISCFFPDTGQFTVLPSCWRTSCRRLEPHVTSNEAGSGLAAGGFEGLPL